MSMRRMTGTIFLVLYLCVTLCALLATVLRVVLPVVPRGLLLFSYGMMAPYQDPGTRNEELLAEGLTANGSWERIDLSRYYPVLFGERNLREYRAMFGKNAPAAERTWLRTSYAATLRRLEQERGATYAGIRLSWLSWPIGSGIFHLRNTPEETEKTLLYEHTYE